MNQVPKAQKPKRHSRIAKGDALDLTTSITQPPKKQRAVRTDQYSGAE